MRPYPVNLPAPLRLLIAIVLVVASAGAGAADYYGSGWYREAGLRQSYDDNVSRAGAPGDVKSDFVTGVDAALGYLWTIGDNRRLSVSGRIAYDRFDEFGDLSNVEAGAEAYYVIQPAPGYTAPWYELSARVARIEPGHSDIRRSTVVDAGLRAGRRLTDAVVAQLGYRYSMRRAQGAVFDTDDHALTLDLDFSLSSAMSAYATYEFHLGDIVSTATPTRWIMAAAEASVPDEAFGRIPGAGYGYPYAYRLDGRTHVVVAGFEFELTNHASLDLSGSYFNTNWQGGGSYSGVTLGAALYLHY